MRRLPHRAAGVVAVPFFLAAGAAGGYLAGLLINNAPAAPVTIVVWAVVAALAAFVSYAGEGATRPPSAMQAAIADGVVAGLGAGAVGAAIDLLVASGAGGNGRVVSVPGLVASLVLAALGGGVVGGLLGIAIGAVGGERLERPAPVRAARGRRRPRSSRRRSRR